ncbi:selenide water dikinase, putative [Hepatocystis sp. ex Piliocolobus tephrosceles]|nr:selenide water dikinase, putative [Hepatocystis sp. ex Piliocolobus tephrosceles]
MRICKQIDPVVDIVIIGFGVKSKTFIDIFLQEGKLKCVNIIVIGKDTFVFLNNYVQDIMLCKYSYIDIYKYCKERNILFINDEVDYIDKNKKVINFLSNRNCLNYDFLLCDFDYTSNFLMNSDMNHNNIYTLKNKNLFFYYIHIIYLSLIKAQKNGKIDIASYEILKKSLLKKIKVERFFNFVSYDDGYVDAIFNMYNTVDVGLGLNEGSIDNVSRNSNILIDNGGMSMDNGGMSMDNGGMSMDNGGMSMDNGGMSMDNGGMSMDNGGVSINDGEASDGIVISNTSYIEKTKKTDSVNNKEININDKKDTCFEFLLLCDDNIAGQKLYNCIQEYLKKININVKLLYVYITNNTNIKSIDFCNNFLIVKEIKGVTNINCNDSSNNNCNSLENKVSGKKALVCIDSNGETINIFYNESINYTNLKYPSYIYKSGFKDSINGYTNEFGQYIHDEYIYFINQINKFNKMEIGYGIYLNIYNTIYKKKLISINNSIYIHKEQNINESLLKKVQYFIYKKGHHLYNKYTFLHNIDTNYWYGMFKKIKNNMYILLNVDSVKEQMELIFFKIKNVIHNQMIQIEKKKETIIDKCSALHEKEKEKIKINNKIGKEEISYDSRDNVRDNGWMLLMVIYPLINYFTYFFLKTIIFFMYILNSDYYIYTNEQGIYTINKKKEDVRYNNNIVSTMPSYVYDVYKEEYTNRLLVNKNTRYKLVILKEKRKKKTYDDNDFNLIVIENKKNNVNNKIDNNTKKIQNVSKINDYIKESINKIMNRNTCGGCGSKVPSNVLSKSLKQLDIYNSKNVFLGVKGTDDCCIFVNSKSKKSKDSPALVQTIDFFKTFIDDEYVLGEIISIHCLSDIYSMGGIGICALSVLIVKDNIEKKLQQRLENILNGICQKLKEEKCVLSGGHTCAGTENYVGLAVTGKIKKKKDDGDVVSKKNSISVGMSSVVSSAMSNKNNVPVGVSSKNNILVDETIQEYIKFEELKKSYSFLPKGNKNIKAGDVIITTKIFGFGFIMAAHICKEAKGRWVYKSLDEMLLSNKKSGLYFLSNNVKACTDVTGFGILGHLNEMIKCSRKEFYLATTTSATDTLDTDSADTDTTAVDISSTDIGSTDIGSTDIGSTDIGVTENGVTENGVTENGVTENGVIENGVTDADIDNAATNVTNTNVTNTNVTNTNVTTTNVTTTNVTTTNVTTKCSPLITPQEKQINERVEQTNELNKPLKLIGAKIKLKDIKIIDGVKECMEKNIYSSMYKKNHYLCNNIINLNEAMEHDKYGILFDPQTSGGLMAIVEKEKANKIINDLINMGYKHSTIIGEIINVQYNKFKNLTISKVPLDDYLDMTDSIYIEC